MSLWRNLLFGKIFAENCMRMKKIGLGASLAPLGSANDLAVLEQDRQTVHKSRKKLWLTIRLR